MRNGVQRSSRSALLARAGVREGANILLLVPFQLFGPNDAPRVGREHEEKHFRKDLLEQVPFQLKEIKIGDLGSVNPVKTICGQSRHKKLERHKLERH